MGDKKFPKFRYFPAKGSAAAETEYKGAVTADAMILFLKTEGKGYFGLQGTLRTFDKLAAEFLKSSDKGAILQRAKDEADATSGQDKNAAAYYVKAMEKTQATADWFH